MLSLTGKKVLAPLERAGAQETKPFSFDGNREDFLVSDQSSSHCRLYVKVTWVLPAFIPSEASLYSAPRA